MLLPATPIPNETKKVSVTDAAGSATLAVTCPQIIITVDDSATGAVFFRTGESSATAVKDTDCPVPKGQYTFTKPDNHMVVSLVCDTGLTATVWITPCMGE